jgi:hypothetical protein
MRPSTRTQSFHCATGVSLANRRMSCRIDYLVYPTAENSLLCQRHALRLIPSGDRPPGFVPISSSLYARALVPMWALPRTRARGLTLDMVSGIVTMTCPSKKLKTTVGRTRSHATPLGITAPWVVRDETGLS